MVEHGQSAPFTAERIRDFITAFDLTLDDQHKLYALAAEGQRSPSIPADCIDYMKQNPDVIEALRLAKDNQFGAAERREMVEQLRRKLNEQE